MEAETEDTENIGLFWTLFNEVLQKVSGNINEKFNPLGWCTDMAGAHMAGICNVFGELAKCCIKSCEFHFKDHATRKQKCWMQIVLMNSKHYAKNFSKV